MECDVCGRYCHLQREQGRSGERASKMEGGSGGTGTRASRSITRYMCVDGKKEEEKETIKMQVWR